MGLFGNKSSDDTKKRIEELKKKIQAEQQAYASGATTVSTPSNQTSASTPSAPAQEKSTQQTPPPPASVPEPMQTQSMTSNSSAEPMQSYQAPRQRHTPHPSQSNTGRGRPLDSQLASLSATTPSYENERVSYSSSRAEGLNGVTLDLGEGFSLNVPVRDRMHMDEFLEVVERVRVLQQLERH